MDRFIISKINYKVFDLLQVINEIIHHKKEYKGID